MATCFPQRISAMFPSDIDEDDMAQSNNNTADDTSDNTIIGNNNNNNNENNNDTSTVGGVPFVGPRKRIPKFAFPRARFRDEELAQLCTIWSKHGGCGPEELIDISAGELSLRGLFSLFRSVGSGVTIRNTVVIRMMMLVTQFVSAIVKVVQATRQLLETSL